MAFLTYSRHGFADPPAAVPLRARCGALNHLTEQMVLWLEETVPGRNCLIAGPRGAGKTTLIDIAYEEAKQAVPIMRPIQVRLHGPSLLRPPQMVSSEPQTDQGSREAVSAHVLRSLVINLYQTLAEEFASCYRERMARLHQRDGAIARREAAEQAAQLRLTLDGAPPAAALRQFLELAGALDSGVLFEPEVELPEHRRDQGSLEIVAVATAAEAYRSCTGVFSREESSEQSSTREQELKLEASARGKEIGQALVSIATGAAVGGGAVAAGVSPLASGLAGAAAALLGMSALSWSATMRQQTSSHQEIKFLPDLTVNGLVHRFLLLLRRLRQAGVAPIFIVDELDKVRDSARLLNDLVTNLKFICADKAFFCFLTDRAYFAQVAQGNRQTSNGMLLTPFTDQLFVLYEIWSLKAHVAETLGVWGVPNDTEKIALEIDKEALALKLVHRSRGLFFHLAQELREINQTQLNAGDPLAKLEHQIFVILQLAVDAILAKPAVAGRIINDADFGQVIHDALYYPTRRWFQGEEDLDCELTAFLEGMAAMDASGASPGLGAIGDEQTDDMQFLHARVEEMLELLCDPAALFERVMGANLCSPAIAQICNNVQPLVSKPDKKRTLYRWRYNRFGAPFRQAKMEDMLDTVNDASPVLDAFMADLASVLALPLPGALLPLPALPF